MHIVSINVAKSQQITVQDRLISTSIFKKPLTGKVNISTSHISGNQQVDTQYHDGGHKAVYAFSANEYDFWAKELDRDDLHYGQFGENLTIKDLDGAQLCIGDKLQIGQCILEVSQPRIPCFKLGIAFNTPTMAKQFIDHGITGMYFKVLQTGSVQAGDKVELVYSHPSQLSVDTLFQAYFDAKITNAIELMISAQAIDALADEWRDKVNDRINSNTISLPS